MRRLLRKTLSEVIYQTTRLKRPHPGGLRILTYHRVTDAHPGERLCVPIARFAEQMRHLREAGYETVTMASAAHWMRHPQIEWPARPVVITFDDGYADNFLHAHPAMARCGFVGVFFVPTQFLQEPPTSEHPDDHSMRWIHLEELLTAGHEIGSHSVTHRRLASLSLEDVQREVGDSKRMLEQQLRRPITSFCYPSGDYNARVKQAVAASGYLAACTVEPGANRPGGDLFALKRTEVSAFDTLRDFKKKLAGAFDGLHAAKQHFQSARRKRAR
jgi:peptidoglycan/xylan/chitin deacetylase (PgdA/CDA1 family)